MNIFSGLLILGLIAGGIALADEVVRRLQLKIKEKKMVRDVSKNILDKVFYFKKQEQPYGPTSKVYFKVAGYFNGYLYIKTAKNGVPSVGHFEVSDIDTLSIPYSRVGIAIQPQKSESVIHYYDFRKMLNQSSFILAVGDDIPKSVLSLSNIHTPYRRSQKVQTVGFDIINEIKSCKEVPDYYFEGCSNLTSIELPDGIKRIGKHAFCNCTKLQKITIPDSVVIIDSSAFESCESLAEVITGESVKIIGDNAFRGCKKLINMDLPISLMHIGEGAFSDCSKLSKIVIPEECLESIYHIETDLECKVLHYGTELCIAKPGHNVTIMLKKGKHKLTFIGTENSQDQYTIFYEVHENDNDYRIEVKLWDLCRSRLIKEGKLVDLGLSVLWASCNLGATKPEEFGDYYAWGETEPKKGKSASEYNYKFHKFNGPVWHSGDDCCTKYCRNDGKMTHDPEDDAASVNLGGAWRMPTMTEQIELLEKCQWAWTIRNGINGYEVTGPNGNTIFLPAAGYRHYTSINDAGSDGRYWSSSLYEVFSESARSMDFDSSDVGRHGSYRYYGQSVRPVAK